MTDDAASKRLILQIERAVLAQVHLRVLVTAAGTTVAGYRQDLRNLKDRTARQSPERE